MSECINGDGRPRYHRQETCEACYRRELRGPDRDQSRPGSRGPGRPAEVVVEEWEHLRRHGFSRKEAALRLGMSHNALEQAIIRHNRRNGVPPRPVRPMVEVIEAWLPLAAEGLSQSRAAERLGMTHAALESAVTRWRRLNREEGMAS